MTDAERLLAQAEDDLSSQLDFIAYIKGMLRREKSVLEQKQAIVDGLKKKLERNAAGCEECAHIGVRTGALWCTLLEDFALDIDTTDDGRDKRCPLKNRT